MDGGRWAPVMMCAMAGCPTTQPTTTQPTTTHDNTNQHTHVLQRHDATEEEHCSKGEGRASVASNWCATLHGMPSPPYSRHTHAWAVACVCGRERDQVYATEIQDQQEGLEVRQLQPFEECGSSEGTGHTSSSEQHPGDGCGVRC